MHQVSPALVLHELDRLLTEREQGLPSPWRIVFPEPVGENNVLPVAAVAPSGGGGLSGSRREGPKETSS